MHKAAICRGWYRLAPISQDGTKNIALAVLLQYMQQKKKKKSVSVNHTNLILTCSIQQELRVVDSKSLLLRLVCGRRGVKAFLSGQAQDISKQRTEARQNLLLLRQIQAVLKSFYNFFHLILLSFQL